LTMYRYVMFGITLLNTVTALIGYLIITMFIISVSPEEKTAAIFEVISQLISVHPVALRGSSYAAKFV
jgi:uncharacterized protein YggT (Ycf19 family)